jgi:hypothetical protein
MAPELCSLLLKPQVHLALSIQLRNKLLLRGPLEHEPRLRPLPAMLLPLVLPLLLMPVLLRPGLLQLRTSIFLLHPHQNIERFGSKRSGKL